MAKLTEKLENRTIKSLKAKDKRYEVRDGDGLVLRVYPTGKKRWYFNYDFQGRRRNMILGEYPGVSLAEARKANRDARGILSKKIDPLIQRQEEERSLLSNPTMKKLVTECLEAPRERPLAARTLSDYKRTYEKYTPDTILRMKVKDIEPRHIIAITDKLIKKDKIVAAQRALAHLRVLFNYAIPKGYISFNPCHKLKIQSKRVSEKRVLSPDEICILWQTLDKFKVDDAIKQAIRFQFLTMTRRGEVCKTEWKHIDWDEEIWTIPESNSKNGKSHRVPLTATALNLLREIQILNGKKKWVFSSIKDNRKHLPPDSVTQAIINNRYRCNFEETFNTHDLRRTAATEATGCNAPRDFVKRALNHTMAGDVTDRYDRYNYDKEKRQVLEIWETRLVDIVK